MPSTILATKLFAPPLRPSDVSRPRLTDLLEGHLDRRLTLVSAPAGYGKTTLVCEWMERTTATTAWVSLDDGDNVEGRFLAHVAAALGNAAGFDDVLKSTQELLRGTKVDHAEVVESIINSISALLSRVVLVLDDYHAINSSGIDRLVAFLIEHAPKPLHIVITTRSDPNLPVGRMRANRELTEIRAADLRFSREEADEFLNGTMQLGLSPDQVATLDQRVEGWIAGLNLAAASLAGQPDRAQQIDSISGNHRFVMDYLLEEALALQPAEIREFLLQTSILDRVNGQLSDAVTGKTGGPEILESLLRQNLFITPLDHKRYWYRYHHLFADLLAQRLKRKHPDSIPDLHARASAWYESDGNLRKAADHALEAGDLERVARLAAKFADVALLQRGDSGSVFRWLDAIPPNKFKEDPRLAVSYAWSLLYALRTDEVAPMLKIAERNLQPGRDDAVLAEVDTVRGSLLAATGAMGESLSYYQQAYERASTKNPAARGIAALGIGYAKMVGGDTLTAGDLLNEAVKLSKEEGNISVSLKASVYLGYVYMERGLLSRARETFESVWSLARMWNLDQCVVMSLADAGRALLELEQNNLKPALALVTDSVRRCGPPGYQKWFSYIVLSLVEMADAQPKAALRTLEAARTAMTGAFMGAVRSTTLACRILALVFSSPTGSDEPGRLEIADWISSTHLTVDRTTLSGTSIFPGRGCEFVHMVGAKALMHLGEHDRALALLQSLKELAVSGGRTRSAIEILVLQAIAADQQGNHDTALLHTLEAVTTAETEGFLRIFVNEGPHMARLLQDTAATRPDTLPYIQRLLAAFPAIESLEATRGRAEDANGKMFESLSERELDVLTLMARGLGNSQIAEELFISTQTVKTHTRNIYGKLDAHSRTQAVSKARGLGLLQD